MDMLYNTTHIKGFGGAECIFLFYLASDVPIQCNAFHTFLFINPVTKFPNVIIPNFTKKLHSVAEIHKK